MKYINKESADIEKEINKLMALIERTTTVNDISELREGLEDFVANYNSISTINGSIVTQSKTLDLVDLIPARHIVRAHRVHNIDEAQKRVTFWLEIILLMSSIFMRCNKRSMIPIW